MCVIFFYVNSNPKLGGYKLILASNRDEFYARNTAQAAKWPGAENVYGGIDLEPGREGGTWLAVSGENGIFKAGALLNLTGEPKPRNAVENDSNHTLHPIPTPHTRNNNNISNITTKNENINRLQPNNNINQTSSNTLHNYKFLLGRGMIVSDYVRNFNDDFDILNYNNNLLKDCEKYSAFNFVSIEIGSSSVPASVTLCSNYPPGLIHYKENTCYGFGNSLPSAPFEKVCSGRNRFQSIVDDFNTTNILPSATDDSRDKLIDNLMDLLKCKEKFWPDAELKRRAPNWGEHLSALNVKIPESGYGSRTHTVILIDAENKMNFIEETMMSGNPEGEWSRNVIEKQYF